MCAETQPAVSRLIYRATKRLVRDFVTARIPTLLKTELQHFALPKFLQVGCHKTSKLTALHRQAALHRERSRCSQQPIHYLKCHYEQLAGVC